jgi:hypothetical protein
VRDIPGAVKKVREYFDLPHGETEDSEIKKWLESLRKDDRGSRVYKAEKWKEAVPEKFGFYIDRFKLRACLNIQGRPLQPQHSYFFPCSKGAINER